MVILNREIVDAWNFQTVAEWLLFFCTVQAFFCFFFRLTSQNLGNYAAKFFEARVRGKELLDDVDEDFCETLHMMDSERDFLLHLIERIKNGDGPEWDEDA